MSGEGGLPAGIWNFMQPSTLDGRHASRATSTSGLDLVTQQTLGLLSGGAASNAQNHCRTPVTLGLTDSVPCGGQPGSAQALTTCCHPCSYG